MGVRGRGGVGTAAAVGGERERAMGTVTAAKESDKDHSGRAKGHWTVAENRRRFLEEFAARRGIAAAEDWRSVQPADLAAAGGAGVLKYHSSSVWRALAELFPEKGFREEECCTRMPRGYWDKAQHQRRFVEELAEELGVQAQEDWRRVSSLQLRRKKGGAALLKRHGSVFRLLCAAYPERRLVEHRCRPQVSAAYWEDAENRRSFLETLKERHAIRSPEGWKALGYNGIVAAGGRRLLEGRPLVPLLQEAFPLDGLTAENCSPAVKQSHWDEAASRRFFDRLAEELHVESAADWAKVTPKDVRERGGTGVLAKKGGSLWFALQKAYKGEFKGEKLCVFESRRKAPQEFWAQVDNVRTFLDIAKNALGIEKPQDWTRVSVAQLRSLRGSGLFRNWTLQDALRAAYPDVTWADVSFSSHSDPTPKRSAQRMLHIHVKNIFPAGLRC